MSLSTLRHNEAFVEVDEAADLMQSCSLQKGLLCQGPLLQGCMVLP